MDQLFILTCIKIVEYRNVTKEISKSKSVTISGVN